MHLISITAKNFQSYEKLDYTFSDGIFLITGKNGSGKSTIFNAIVFALYGKIRSSLDSIIQRGKNYCSTELIFSNVNSGTFKIIRERNEKCSFLKYLFLNPEGIWIDLSSNRIDETQEKIEKEIGVNYDIFLSSVYFAPKELDVLIKKSPSERKEIFFDILNLKVYEIAFLKTNTILKEIESEINNINQEIKIKEEYLESSKKIVTMITEELKVYDFEEYKKELELYKQKIEIAEKQRGDFYNICKNYELYEKYSLDLNSLESELQEQNKNLEENEISTKKYLLFLQKNEINKLKVELKSFEAGKVCNACGSIIKTKEQKIKEEELRGLIEKVNLATLRYKDFIENTADIKNKINLISKKINESKDFLNEYKNYKMENPTILKRNYALLSKEIEQFKDSGMLIKEKMELYSKKIFLKNDKQKFIEDSGEEIKKIKIEYDKLSTDYKNYEVLQKAFGKNGLPSFIIENVLPEVEEYANELLHKYFNYNIGVNFSVLKETKSGNMKDTLDIFIVKDDKKINYDCFSDGEKSRIAIVIRLALSKLLSMQFGTQFSFLLLDEIDYLDEEGLDNLFSAINSLNKIYSTILFISHQERLINKFDNILSISKCGNNSKIEEITNFVR